MLKAEDDPVVLRTVAEQAECAFPAFLDLALGMELTGDDAILLTRIARFMHHPDLKRVIAVVGRSTAPAVRIAVAELWTARPDLLDEDGLVGLTTDPSVPVRRAAVQAWGAARYYGQLAAQLGDPDPGVRQDIALAFQDAPDTDALEPLFLDPDEMVRAALFVVRLLRGEWTEPPDNAGISRPAAATMVRRAGPLDALRELARTDQDPARRLPAALALAVLGDEAAYTVLRTDPQWAIRDKVGRLLTRWRDPLDEPRSA